MNTDIDNLFFAVDVFQVSSNVTTLLVAGIIIATVFVGVAFLKYGLNSLSSLKSSSKPDVMDRYYRRFPNSIRGTGWD